MVYISINTVGILAAEAIFRIVLLTGGASMPLATLSALLVLVFVFVINQILEEMFESWYATDRKI